MRLLGSIIISCALIGCAAKPGTQSLMRAPATTQSVTAATRPANDPGSLSLEELPPLRRHASTQPASEPTGPAPLESLELYARARDAIIQNQRYTAITLLEKA